MLRSQSGKRSAAALAAIPAAVQAHCRSIVRQRRGHQARAGPRRGSGHPARLEAARAADAAQAAGRVHLADQVVQGGQVFLREDNESRR